MASSTQLGRRKFHRHWLAVTATLLLLAGAAHARSKSPPPPPAAVEPPPAAAPATPAATQSPRPVKDDAPSHVARARELFQEQKFGEAGDELLRAYTFDAKPLFLFNAGQAYRKTERRKDALTMYQRYLEVAPDGPLAAEARGYTADLQALLKADENMKDVNLRLESEKSRTEALEESLKNERKRPVYKHPAFIVGMSLLGVVVVVAAGTFIGLGVGGHTDLGNMKFTF